MRNPVFIDLDETLVYAADESLDVSIEGEKAALGDFHVLLRAEARAILEVCREGKRPVYLFTFGTFDYAAKINVAFGLGFTEETIFSQYMIYECRPNLCPNAVLIDNCGPDEGNTEIKMKALGISKEQVWLVPGFEPPHFPSARNFLAGLPWRLQRHDRIFR